MRRMLVVLVVLAAVSSLVGVGIVVAGTVRPLGSGEPEVTAQQQPITPRFSYQGRLTQSGGLVNGSCDFEFSLWNRATGGSQIGPTNTAAGLTVIGGLFSVELNFLDNAFDGTTRFLEIDVVCPPGSGALTTLSPRQEIIGVPQAAFAIEAKQMEWTGLLNRPDGLNDGDDDTQLSNTEVRAAVSGTTIDLAAGSLVGGAAISVGNHTTDQLLSDAEVDAFVANAAIDLAAGSLVGGAAISVGNHTTDTLLSDGEVRTAVRSSAIDLAAGSSVSGTAISTGDHTTQLPWTSVTAQPQTVGGLSCSGGEIVVFVSPIGYALPARLRFRYSMSWTSPGPH